MGRVFGSTEPGICTRCGADAPYGRNTAGHCSDCHNLDVAEYRARRKEQLAREPRCEVDGCTRRGALVVAGSTLMCKGHYERATRALGGYGIFGTAFQFNQAGLLRLAGRG